MSLNRVNDFSEIVHNRRKGCRKEYVTAGVALCAVVFVLMSMVLLPSSTVSAAEETTVTVSRVYETSRRNEFAVDVYLNNPAGMASGMLELEYNEEVLELRSENIIWGEVLEDFTMNTENLKKPGLLHVSWVHSSGVSESGYLFTARFRLRSENAVSDLLLSRLEMYTEDGAPVPVRILNGRVSGFSGKTWEVNEEQSVTVAQDKDWTIVFGSPVNRAAVNPLTVYVTSVNGGSRIPGAITVSNDGRSVNYRPLENYAPGDYILTITEQLCSHGGVSLREPIRRHFKVE